MAHKRTTHRNSVGRKLYALRDARGKFFDNHPADHGHERTWRQDLRRETIPDRHAKKR